MTDNNKEQSDSAKSFENLALQGNRFQDLLQDKNLTEHIRERMRKMLMDELSNLSPLFREALREWIKKHHTAPEDTNDAEKKLLTFEKRINDLIDENTSLKRKLELRDKESKMMLDTLKQLMNKKKIDPETKR